MTIIDVNTSDYSFSYIPITYSNEHISPHLELCRNEEADSIKTHMASVLMKYKMKPKRRSIRDNINHMFARILFHTYSSQQLSNYDDPMFHSTHTQNSILHDDISTLFRDGKLVVDTVVNEIDIQGRLKRASINMCKYEQREKVHKTPKQYNTTTTHKTVIYTIRTTRYKYKFHIPHNVYNKLKRRYIEYDDKSGKVFIDLVCCLLLRYNTISSIGNQFGIPIAVKDKFRILGFDFECFASSLNHHYKYYCSVFYDIEKYFMSLGHFQNITYRKGLFMANPPYELSLLNTMVDTITKSIKSSGTESIVFCYGTPTWASYGTFEFHRMSRSSKFYKMHHTFDNYQVPWFDFMNNRYVKIPSSTRYVLANRNVPPIREFKKILKYWINYKE